MNTKIISFFSTMLIAWFLLLSIRNTAHPQISSPELTSFNLGKLNPTEAFIENKGQWPEEVLFAYRAGGLQAFITKEGLVCNLIVMNSREKERMSDNPDFFEDMEKSPPKLKNHVITFQWKNPNKNFRIKPNKPLEIYHNYYLGNDPTKWASRVPLWEEVWIENIYVGIDLRWYIDNGCPRFDFVVRPEGDYRDISMVVNGSEGINLDDEIVSIKTPLGDIDLKDLHAYAYVGNKKIPISAFWTKKEDRNITFNLSNVPEGYSSILIDPIIYSSIFGGNFYDDLVHLSTVNNCELVAVGTTLPFYIPSNEFDDIIAAPAPFYEVMVLKINYQTGNLIFSTMFGGSSQDQALSCTIGPNGDILVAGGTASTNFPIFSSAIQTTLNAGWDGFLTKLSSSGTISYSSYLAGTGSFDEKVHDIKFNSSGELCFAVNRGTQIVAGKLNNSLNNYLLNTVIISGQVRRLEVDPNGYFYLTGIAYQVNFPVTSNAYDNSFNGSGDAFLSILDPSGTLIYSTYFGGSDKDLGLGLFIENNILHLCGKTKSTNFPLLNPFDNSISGYDGFFALFDISNVNSPTLLSSSFIGGSSDDEALGCFRLSNGSISIVGNTVSPNFPVTQNAFDPSFNGNSDIFITILNTQGTSISYSTFFGSPYYDGLKYALADLKGKIFFCGTGHSSTFFPIVNSNYNYNALHSGFVTVFNYYHYLLNQSFCLNQNINPITLYFKDEPSISVNNLPPGLIWNYTYNNNNNIGTLTISGTPSQAGNFSFSILGLISNYCTNLSGNFIVINSAPQINIQNGSLNQNLCTGQFIQAVEFWVPSGSNVSISGLPSQFVLNYVGGNLWRIQGHSLTSASYPYQIIVSNSCGSNIFQGVFTFQGTNSTYLGNRQICIQAQINTFQTQFLSPIPVSNFSYYAPTGVNILFNSAHNVFEVTGPTPQGESIIHFVILINESSGCPTVLNGSINFNLTNDYAIIPSLIPLNYSYTTGSIYSSNPINLNVCSGQNIQIPIGWFFLQPFVGSNPTFSLPEVIFNNTGLNVDLDSDNFLNIIISGTPSSSGHIIIKLEHETVYDVYSTSGIYYCFYNVISFIRININVIPPPEISVVFSQNPICINQPYQSSFLVSHAPNPQVQNAPSWLSNSFNTSNNLLVLSGIPDLLGNYAIQINVSNQCGTDQHLEYFSVVDAPPPSVSQPSENPVVCIGSSINPINFSVDNVLSMGSPAGLPSGVTAQWISNQLILTGTPSEFGTFNYSIPLSGSCTNVNASGTITVQPNNTISLDANSGPSNPTLCVNSPLLNIVYQTTGATGASVTGLPPGVSGTFNAGNGTLTISGTPSQPGTFSYTVNLTGGCGAGTASGTITVSPAIQVTLPNTNTACQNSYFSLQIPVNNANAINVTGLPPGLNWSFPPPNNFLYINGTPTQTGSFAVSISASNTGGCSSNLTYNLTVNPPTSLTLSSGPNTHHQTVCSNQNINQIKITKSPGSTFQTSGNLPPGIFFTTSGNDLIIQGPAMGAPGVYSFTVFAIGSCGTATHQVTIQVLPFAQPVVLNPYTYNPTPPAFNPFNIVVSRPRNVPIPALRIIFPSCSLAYRSLQCQAPLPSFIPVVLQDLSPQNPLLPSGLTCGFQGTHLVISGTPIQSGTFDFQVTVNTCCGNITFRVRLWIFQVVTISQSIHQLVLNNCSDERIENLEIPLDSLDWIKAIQIPEEVHYTFDNNRLILNTTEEIPEKLTLHFEGARRDGQEIQYEIILRKENCLENISKEESNDAGALQNSYSLNSYHSQFNNTIGSEIFNFYPNPTFEKIFVEVRRTKGILSIYNSSGQKITSFLVQNLKNEISLENYKPGLYFIEYKEEDGDISIGKLVKIDY
ncbi:MAG: T9SS type A sorting domain-containing protein [Flavobacteriales bacterium]|nr:T9SS type A sorting domain-containing protein [Flavobacteriales bacterium]